MLWLERWLQQPSCLEAMPRRCRQEDADEIDNLPVPLLLPLPKLVGTGPPRPGWMPWRLLNIMMLLERVTLQCMMFK